MGINPHMGDIYQGLRDLDARLVFWGTRSRVVPTPAGPTENYSEDDDRHWYDYEFAGHGDAKESILKSSGDGPRGKHIVVLKAESGDYQRACEISMAEFASVFDIELSIRITGWSVADQQAAVLECLEDKPDMIIDIPQSLSNSTRWYAQMFDAGIPVISSTLMPASEAFRYVTAWCGHDAWAESRLLAQKFAALMKYRGGYCIVAHMPDTSVYYARSYGIITELKKIAPDMHCLALESSCLDRAKTERIVKRWITEFGERINGIVTANDNAVLAGANAAIAGAGGKRIIRASNGSTRRGLFRLKEGELDAITFKSPRIDGSVPIQLAVDWFNGLTIKKFTYLPVHVVTRSDVDEFLNRKEELEGISLNDLTTLIAECNFPEIIRFFDAISLQLLCMKVVSVDMLRGFSIEILSHIIAIVHDHRLDEKRVIGSYETVFRSLFYQPTLQHTIAWLRETAISTAKHLERQEETKKPEPVLHFITENYAEPLSLKLLGLRFGYSPGYLGRWIRSKTGQTFNDYLATIRVRRAEAYLRNTTLSTASISQAVGFGTTDYFYRVFRSKTGITPSCYRHKHQNQAERYEEIVKVDPIV